MSIVQVVQNAKKVAEVNEPFLWEKKARTIVKVGPNAACSSCCSLGW